MGLPYQSQCFQITFIVSVAAQSDFKKFPQGPAAGKMILPAIFYFSVQIFYFSVQLPFNMLNFNKIK